MEKRYTEIKALIDQEKVDQAMQELDEIIAQDEPQEIAFYLKGNIYRKKLKRNKTPLITIHE